MKEIKMSDSDFTDPLEAYVESFSAEVVEVEVTFQDPAIQAEPSIMGLSPEREEEFFFTLFFD
jgi:hypothetical protein